jgi:hypothetical protein
MGKRRGRVTQPRIVPLPQRKPTERPICHHHAMKAHHPRCPAAWRRAALTCLVPLAALSSLSLAGCDRAPPHPVAHAQLHIGADGRMEFDKVPVTPAELADSLEKRKAGTPDLLVEIHASPKASIAAVETALHTVVAAHARLSYGEEHPGVAAPLPASGGSGLVF